MLSLSQQDVTERRVGLPVDGIDPVVECKFQESPLGYDALSTLRTHADELRWSPRDGSERVTECALFSRSGFEQSVEEAADQRDDLRLFTAVAVVDALSAGGS